MMLLHVCQFTTLSDSTYLVTTDPSGAGFVSKVGSNPYQPPEYAAVKEGRRFEFTSYQGVAMGDQPKFFFDGKQVLQTSQVKQLDEGFSSTDLDEHLVDTFCCETYVWEEEA